MKEKAISIKESIVQKLSTLFEDVTVTHKNAYASYVTLKPTNVFLDLNVETYPGKQHLFNVKISSPNLIQHKLTYNCKYYKYIPSLKSVLHSIYDTIHNKIYSFKNWIVFDFGMRQEVMVIYCRNQTITPFHAIRAKFAYDIIGKIQSVIHQYPDPKTALNVFFNQYFVWYACLVQESLVKMINKIPLLLPLLDWNETLFMIPRNRTVVFLQFICRDFLSSTTIEDKIDNLHKLAFAALDLAIYDFLQHYLKNDKNVIVIDESFTTKYTEFGEKVGENGPIIYVNFRSFKNVPIHKEILACLNMLKKFDNDLEQRVTSVQDYPIILTNKHQFYVYPHNTKGTKVYNTLKNKWYMNPQSLINWVKM